jgi:phospholipid transport system substrate-binding protein
MPVRPSPSLSRRSVLAGSTTLLPALFRKRRAGAAEGDTAAGFIRDVGRELPRVLAGATSVEEKRLRLVPFLARIVAIEPVARFCMGRYWHEASAAQREDFVRLLLDIIARAVAERGNSYSSGASQITILPGTEHGTEVTVPTIVRNGDEAPIRVTWLVDASRDGAGGGQFHILDVLADGISLRQTLRSDYTAFLNQHGGDIALFLQSLRTLAPRVGG